jgi:hypothetical protein
MPFPWYAGTMLALESNNVIALRMIRLAAGGSDAAHEAHLMVNEKIDAMFEAWQSLWTGAAPITVIDGYRTRVAANAKRLTEEDGPL